MRRDCWRRVRMPRAGCKGRAFSNGRLVKFASGTSGLSSAAASGPSRVSLRRPFLGLTRRSGVRAPGDAADGARFGDRPSQCRRWTRSGPADLGRGPGQQRWQVVPASGLVAAILTLRSCYDRVGFHPAGRRDFDGRWHSAVVLEKQLA
jgi:hypothetical protein